MNKKVFYYPGNPLQLDLTVKNDDTLEQIRETKSISKDKKFYIMKQIKDEKQKVKSISEEGGSFIVLTQIGTPEGDPGKVEKNLNSKSLKFTFKNRNPDKELEIFIGPTQTIHDLDTQVIKEFKFNQRRIQYILNGMEIDEKECAAHIAARNRCDRPIYVFETSQELPITEETKPNTEIAVPPSNDTKPNENIQTVNNLSPSQTETLEIDEKPPLEVQPAMLTAKRGPGFLSSPSDDFDIPQFAELDSDHYKPNFRSKRNSLLSDSLKITSKPQINEEDMDSDASITIIENKPQKQEQNVPVVETTNSSQETKLVLVKSDDSKRLEADISNINTFDNLTGAMFSEFECPEDELISYMDPTNGDIIELKTPVSKFAGKTVIFGISGEIDKKAKEIKNKQNKPNEPQEKKEEEEKKEPVVEKAEESSDKFKGLIPKEKVFIFVYDTKIGEEVDADETTIETFNEEYFDKFNLKYEAEIAYIEPNGTKISFDSYLKDFGGQVIIIRYASDLENALDTNAIYKYILDYRTKKTNDKTSKENTNEEKPKDLPVEKIEENKNEEEIEIIEHKTELVEEKKEEKIEVENKKVGEKDNKIESIPENEEEIVIIDTKPLFMEDDSKEEEAPFTTIERPIHTIEMKNEEKVEYKQNNQVEEKKEIPIEEKKENPVEEKKEIPIEEKKENPVEEKKEIPIEEKKEIPIEEKKEIPIEEKKENPVEEKKEIPIEEKKENPVEEKKEIPIEEKKENPVEEKKEIPIEEKKENPVEEKKEIPIEEKKENPVEEKKEIPIEEKKENPVEEKKEIPIEEKKENPVEEKKENPVEEKKEEIDLITESPISLIEEKSELKDQENEENIVEVKQIEVKKEEKKENPVEEKKEIPIEEKKEIPIEEKKDGQNEVKKEEKVEKKAEQKEEFDDSDSIQIIEEKPAITTSTKPEKNESGQSESNDITGLIPKDKVFFVTHTKSFQIELDADSTTFNDFNDKYYDDFELDSGDDLYYLDLIENKKIDLDSEYLNAYGGKVILIIYSDLYYSLDKQAWIDYIISIKGGMVKKENIEKAVIKEEKPISDEDNEIIIQNKEEEKLQFNKKESNEDDDIIIIEKKEEENSEPTIEILFHNSNEISTVKQTEILSINNEKTFTDIKNELIEKCPKLSSENIIFRDSDYVAIDDSEKVSFYKDQSIHVILDPSIDLSNNNQDDPVDIITLS